MQWTYTDYPVMDNGRPRLISGIVEIQATTKPRLPVIKIGANEVATIPRPMDMPYLKWRITSQVSEDLRRFIAGKYWHRIDAALVAEHLRERGLGSADSYARFARG